MGTERQAKRVRERRLGRLAEVVGLDLDSAYDRLALAMALEAITERETEDDRTQRDRHV